MSWERTLFRLPYAALDRPYEECAAEYRALCEKEARLLVLEWWRARQAMKAAPDAEKAPAGELPAVASFW